MTLSLILEVDAQHAAQFGARARKVFEGRGGSIGRSDDCDWVLATSGVSRVHAMVRLLNGLYFIEDRSTNGMLHNDVPLVKGEPSSLRDGDRLQIDNFEVSCRLAEAGAEAPMPDLLAPAPAPRAAVPSPAAAPAADPFDFGGMFDSPGRAAAPPPSTARPASSDDPLGDWLDGGGTDPGQSQDPLSFLDAPQSAAPGRSPALPSGWDHSGLDGHFRPPTAAPSAPGNARANALPDDWDLGFDAPAQAPAPAAPPPPAPRPSPAVAPVAAAAPLPADVDAIFRIVVDGVMDVLRARAEIKNSFRLPVTVIQRSENNPLKFAPNADEALQKILAPPSSAFLSGVAAFQDAFDDIRCHQMAMLAGVRAAFDSMLHHFSPTRFEQEADVGGKRSMLEFGSGKARYWERYREQFEALNSNPDDCFRRLFGDEFARAYEEQLARLKSARRLQKPADRS